MRNVFTPKTNSVALKVLAALFLLQGLLNIAFWQFPFLMDTFFPMKPPVVVIDNPNGNWRLEALERHYNSNVPYFNERGHQFPWETIGGVFSIVCAFLLLSNSRAALQAVILRCLGGILNFSTAFFTSQSLFQLMSFATTNPYKEQHMGIFVEDLGRVFSVTLFLIAIIVISSYMAKNNNTIEKRKSGLFLTLFCITMIVSWLSVFFYLSSAFSHWPG